MKSKILPFVASISLAIFCLLGQSGLCATKSKEDVRHFNFSSDYLTGKLCIRLFRVATESCVPAKGVVTITVPPGRILVLEINPHVLEHPERLANLQTEGIDGLKIAFMSMEDNSVCDEVFKKLPKFTHPVDIDASRSDLTEVGLSAFKSLPYLKRADFFMTGITASFLKKHALLTRLEELNLGSCAVNENYLQYLVNLPRLTHLSVFQSNVTDTGVKYISKNSHLVYLNLINDRTITDDGVRALSQIHSLKQLRLSNNPRITDKSISTFLAMRDLETLALDGTSVTFAGVSRLQSLHLKVLFLPKHFYEVEMIKLRKLFPKTLIKAVSDEPSQDIQIQFAPMAK